MLKFTICFIKQGSRILLMNREKASWMGMWNGVGGKIEPGETPRESILREIAEETGIRVESVAFKGLTTWLVDGVRVGGMYTYLAELPEDELFEVPFRSEEGILDWKEQEWILHPDNRGVAYNIPQTLEQLISADARCWDYRCVYEGGQLVHFEMREIEPELERVQDSRVLEERVFRDYLEGEYGRGRRVDEHDHGGTAQAK